MLSRRLIRLQATSSRLAPGTRFYNPLNQSRQSGRAVNDPRNASPVDAANPEGRKQAAHGEFTGNTEGVGFADQVGSQSTSGSNVQGVGVGGPESAEGITGQESITPPSFVDAVKDKLGFKTTAGEDKQNRGGGRGVTGAGRLTFDNAKRTIHTSVVARMPAKTRGQASEESMQPKDKIYAEQNPHLKHKSKAGSPDTGKGNADKDLKLPSHESSNTRKRAFHTSARSLQEKDSTPHTADSYLKDVDDTAPVNPKVHQVDSSSDTGAPVALANEQPATGNFSRAGPDSPEYETVCFAYSMLSWPGEVFTLCCDTARQTSKHDQPYDTKPTRGPEAEQKLRYGGQATLGGNTSKPDEGPSGKAAEGRKPEGY
ncbi:hypothetical protein BDY19DRAFT_136472 [Irpex rosettiformis]|uniref:Uncharacterized protein n=1 Tax=Irpex rosettiformis TaxID=378272 RepID=A0ACB8U4R1_9APHY|nr:hypothetical protein BDY19DRAFT_136472 [Irpex rosettiformis]